MFKGMKTTLLVVTGLAVGYFGTMLAGCGTAPGHGEEVKCDSTAVVCDTVATTVTEAAVEVSEEPKEVTEVSVTE
jgi:predicted small secreted protein